jgi:hypothetical protein
LGRGWGGFGLGFWVVFWLGLRARDFDPRF